MPRHIFDLIKQLDTVNGVLKFVPKELYTVVKFTFIINDTLKKKVYLDCSMGYCINLESCNFITILAKYEKYNEITKFLITKHNDEAKNSKNLSLLMIASIVGNNELCEFLIKRKVNLDSQDIYGKTALMYACQYLNPSCSIETVKSLIDAGANLDFRDKFGFTALSIASDLLKPYETVKLLVEAGANVNLGTDVGYTPLMFVSRYGNTESSFKTVKLLLEAGANPNSQTKCGSTVLMEASLWSPCASVQTIKLLIESGAKLDSQKSDGTTALINVCKQTIKLYDVIKTLVEAGANLYLKDNRGNSAMTYLEKDEEMVEFVKNCGLNKEINKFKSLCKNDKLLLERINETINLLTNISKVIAISKKTNHRDVLMNLLNKNQ